MSISFSCSPVVAAALSSSCHYMRTRLPSGLLCSGSSFFVSHVEERKKNTQAPRPSELGATGAGGSAARSTREGERKARRQEQQQQLSTRRQRSHTQTARLFFLVYSLLLPSPLSLNSLPSSHCSRALSPGPQHPPRLTHTHTHPTPHHTKHHRNSARPWRPPAASPPPPPAPALRPSGGRGGPGCRRRGGARRGRHGRHGHAQA